MLRLGFILVFCCTTVLDLNGQVYHDLGIGFSGLRIWEPSKPGNFNEDLDYYWNPQVSYQLHFLEERLVSGLEFGWVYAKGLKDEPNFFREDIQKSLNLDIEAGVNVFKFKNSILQWRAGVRLTKTYFYSREVLEFEENSVSGVSGSNESWQDVNYDLTSAISYQFNLSRNRSSNLALRFTLDMVYFFPEKHKLEYLEQDYRFAMGPSFSLIWRIKQKRNRGLF